MQTAIKGSKSGDWSVAEDGTVTAGGLALVEGEFTLETVADSGDGHTATGMLPRGGFVVLDTEVTPELAAEGVARDLVRAGAAGPPRRRPRRLGPDRADDRRPGAVVAAARAHEPLVAAETLATSVTVLAGGDDADGRGAQGLSASRRRWATPTRRVGADGPGTRPICADSAGCGPSAPTRPRLVG